MSRLKDLGEILDSYEGREYRDNIPKTADVKVWEELQDHMRGKKILNKLMSLNIPAKHAVYKAYESARKLSWLRKYKGQDETYLKDLAQLLSKEEDMNQILRWANWRIGHYDSAFEEFGDGEL